MNGLFYVHIAVEIYLTNNSRSGRYDRRYGSLSLPTFHRCVINIYTLSDWTAAQNDRFFEAADVEDGTDVVDTRRGGYQSMAESLAPHDHICMAFVEWWGGVEGKIKKLF